MVEGVQREKKTILMQPIPLLFFSLYFYNTCRTGSEWKPLKKGGGFSTISTKETISYLFWKGKDDVNIFSLNFTSEKAKKKKQPWKVS